MHPPLQGLQIIEFGAIGPAPFAAMMLADHGAEVIRIDRPGKPSRFIDPVGRSRRRIVPLDLKNPDDVKAARDLARSADGVIEGLRPGVMERLGLGPDDLLRDNPKLVYGRMTGWGQTGPLSQAAGHDLNYIALSGALQGMGLPGQKPPVPLNLVGDYGAGGMLLAFGMLSAIHAARTTGQGQIVDAAISDGAALLMAMFSGRGGQDPWAGGRGSHQLSGAAHFYNTYETADGEYVAIGAIEPQFYRLLLEKLDLGDDPDFASQMDKSRWPQATARLETLFRTRTRAQWCDLLEGTDVCFAPVLSLAEAALHPHNVARQTFVEAFGINQPAPAPRYSRSKTVFPAASERSDSTGS